MEQYEEYEVFTVIASDGSEVELAVMEEFEAEGKRYLAAAKVEQDTISDEGVFLYRIKEREPELVVEKILDAKELEMVAGVYEELM